MYNRQNNVLAPKPATFKFLKTVFQEIAELFPSPYFHLGGDECSKMWWKQDIATQDFMKAKGLPNEKALQAYFIEQVAGYLKEKNKMAIGWHEVLESKIDIQTIIMNWGDNKPALEAVAKNHRVIMTPGKPLYFDHYQSETIKDSLAIHGFNSWQAVYQVNLLPAEIVKQNKQQYILGAQANVWTEYMAYPTKVDYMIFPRMTALSEVLWSYPQQRDTFAFTQRLLQTALPRYRFWNSSFFWPN
jgi:hexosaminidase